MSWCQPEAGAVEAPAPKAVTIVSVVPRHDEQHLRLLTLAAKAPRGSNLITRHPPWADWNPTTSKPPSCYRSAAVPSVITRAPSALVRRWNGSEVLRALRQIGSK
jgi:hypothetical protein